MFESLQKYMSEGERNFFNEKPLPKETPKKIAKRRYEGARINRVTNDWTASSLDPNSILRMDLKHLRRRSRDLSKNDPYVKRYFQLCRTNIVGKGFNLQVQASGDKMARDQALTSKIEKAFADWGRSKDCSHSGKVNFLQAQQLFTNYLSRDGEAICRIIRDDENKYGISLKFYDPDWLDETYSTVLSSGNRVMMSVELDSNDKPIAYWFTELMTAYPQTRKRNRERFRVDAKEIIHSFIVIESEEQVRGVPWGHASMLRSFMLYAYEEADLEKRRIEACQTPFLVPPVDLDVKQFEGDDEEESATIYDLEPGQVPVLKPGWSVSEFKPSSDGTAQDFKKNILRGLASGLGISYHTLAGDLESVNYSSARIGSLDDRDFWREMQKHVTSDFLEPIYMTWHESAFLNGVLDITFSQYERTREPIFHGRGWAWVDPAKDMVATTKGLTAGILTFTEVLAEQGKDVEEHFKTIQKETKLAEKYGIDIRALLASADKNQVPQPKEDDDDKKKVKKERKLHSGLSDTKKKRL